jgi:hypothetical protein
MKKAKRKFKPVTIRDMAYRRGLAVLKAKRGGWYVMLAGAPWGVVVYASHEWLMIENFIRKQPILIKRNGA